MLLLGSALGVLAIYSPAAFAAGAPIVTTGTPEFSSSLTTAELKGTVDPNGGTGTTYKVEYGKTKLYGKTTPSLAISGTGAVPFRIELPGVEEMSTYHFRVSATNNLGTTVTSDALFETLISWKVEGKRISELPSPVSFEDNYKGKAGEGGHVEFRGTVGGVYVRVYCRQSTSAHGILGVEYTGLVFNNGCFTQLNGTKSAPCQPLSGITLNLDRAFAQTSTITVPMSEECAIGEKLTFSNGGFSPPIGLAESTAADTTFYGMTYGVGGLWETAYSMSGTASPGSWKLIGADAGKKFGIS
jgi:hypothetical protein